MYKIGLSPYQKIFYEEWKINPNSSMYNIVFDQTILNLINIPRLESAINRFISENILFNSHISEIDGNYFWIPNNRLKPLDLFGNYSFQDINLYVSKPFNLLSDPLYRVAVINETNFNHRIIIVLHHLIIDGSLMESFINEISKYYNQDTYSQNLNYEEQKAKIKLFVTNFNSKVSKYKSVSQNFWSEILQDIESIDLRFLKLPYNLKNLSENNNIKQIRFNLCRNQINELYYVLTKFNISIYKYSLYIFAILLYRYTSQDRFVISYPVSIKDENKFIYGAKINTNFMPFYFNQSTTIEDIFYAGKQFAEALKADLLKVDEYNHGYFPINNIIASGINKELLKVCFAQTNLKDTKLNFVDGNKVIVNQAFDIDFEAGLFFEQEVKRDSVDFKVKYNNLETDVFILKNFIEHYKKLFKSILRDLKLNILNKPVLEYNILSLKEYTLLTEIWNGKHFYYHKEKTINQLFEDQVIQTPNNIALVYENNKLTYEELDNICNTIAHFLKNTYQVSKNDLVGIYLDRNEWMIISIIAVLKAGGAYLPLDPNYPVERIEYILSDAKAKLLLSSKKYKTMLSKIVENRKLKTPVEVLENFKYQENWNSYLKKSFNKQTTSQDLAYIIYTSGTTGNPKGVMIKHEGVINLIYYMINLLELNQYSRIAQFSNFVFDASVYEIFPCISCGGTLHILSEPNKQNHEKLLNYYNDHFITATFLPTILLKELCFKIEQTCLKKIYTGGENFDGLNYLPSNITIINQYGLTETTVCATDMVIKNKEYIKIGKPIQNVKAYVLDKNQKILPIGAVGELHIGGVGVAKGYLNQPDLFKDKFIYKVFSNRNLNDSQKIFKTGDLVRWTPDGNIEYLGRNDFQVKINGHRVELQEVENKLMSYKGIKQCIVLVTKLKDQSHTCLIGYYVSDNKLIEEKILKYLRKNLPEYMIPRILISIEEIPLNLNGKLNKDLLPLPIISNAYIPATNFKEQKICEAFAKSLGLFQISITDDFFRLGGNSVIAIRLSSILHQNFDITVSDIFNLRTPQLLAKKCIFQDKFINQKLAYIKRYYVNFKRNDLSDNKKIKDKLDDYFQEIISLKIDRNLLKPIHNILLTGATGFLGCNILNQIIEQTNYNIYLLIRAISYEQALEKISNKYKLYFNQQLSKQFNKRVFVLKADIELTNLGISASDYNFLVGSIDSVIHSAALVKHYGNINEFYLANVQVTINLLELTKLTKLKDFHYISTYSVLNHSYFQESKLNIYTEQDLPNNIDNFDNIYIKTKLQGELETVKYRSYGIKSNIYRVGNLAFMMKNFKLQENIIDNAFANWIMYILKIKSVFKEISLVELSPADMTAQAIIKIFDKAQLFNSIFNVFNPNLINILEISQLDNRSLFEKMSIEDFFDKTENLLSDNDYQDLIMKFILRQGWLDESLDNIKIKFKVLQNKTQHTLKQLNFNWMPINNEQFRMYINNLIIYMDIKNGKKSKNS